jgi:Outer membrane protein beta-barrel domain
MKSFTLVALATLTTAAFAGQPIAGPGKGITPEPCFGETELQLDVFGAYHSSSGSFGDGWGGGLGVNYFFSRYLGLGVDVALTDGDDDSIWTYRGSLLARYPIDFGNHCLAPYLRVSGGIQSEDDDESFIGVGGGLEWRVTPRFGIFGEGSYNWAEDDNDFATARAGVRFVF